MENGSKSDRENGLECLLVFLKPPGHNFKASMFPSMFFVPIFIDFSYKISEASRKSRMSLYLI